LPQSLFAIYDKATGDSDINASYFTWNFSRTDDAFLFYFFVGSVAILTGFFVIPLLILVYVQLGNFWMGKTMLERYSKSA
jgi:hypothetical protein